MASRLIHKCDPKQGIKRYRRELPAGLLALTLLVSISCTQSDVAKPANTASTNSAEAKKEGNYITASPNPVPVGPGNGKTSIAWRTRDIPASEVHVYVVGPDGKENLFATAPEGTQEAPWISGQHEFRLYQGSGADRKLLDKVLVTRGEQ